MIFTERTITVRKGTSTINESIILYRGDFQVGLKFTILDSKYKFLNGANLIESEKATYAQLAVLKPKGDNIFSDVVKCSEGSVTFTMTKEMIDELEEVGKYSFQIRLFDANRESRVSIPPVEFGMEVREPVASEDHTNKTNEALTGYSIAKVTTIEEDKKVDTFDSNDNYNKTNWQTGDRITENKLNKVEDALYKLSQNDKTLDTKISSNFNILSTIKADKAELDVERQRIDTFTKLPSGSTSGDAELIDARIGHDGYVHTNVGSAIRDGFSRIYNGIKVEQTFSKTGIVSVPINLRAYEEVTLEIVDNNNVLSNGLAAGIGVTQIDGAQPNTVIPNMTKNKPAKLTWGKPIKEIRIWIEAAHKLTDGSFTVRVTAGALSENVYDNSDKIRELSANVSNINNILNSDSKYDSIKVWTLATNTTSDISGSFPINLKANTPIEIRLSGYENVFNTNHAIDFGYTDIDGVYHNGYIRIHKRDTITVTFPKDVRELRIWASKAGIIANGSFDLFFLSIMRYEEVSNKVIEHDNDITNMKKLIGGPVNQEIKEFKATQVIGVTDGTSGEINVIPGNFKKGETVFISITPDVSTEYYYAIGLGYPGEYVNNALQFTSPVYQEITLKDDLEYIRTWAKNTVQAQFTIHITNVDSFKTIDSRIKALEERETSIAQKGTKGLSFNVVGDSYSTYRGWIPNGNAIWYPTSDNSNNVKRVQDTWWWLLANNTGMTLKLNDSWSGSTICYTGYSAAYVKNNAMVTRVKTHMGETKALEPKPDIIFLFGGTNDSWAGSPVGANKYSDRTEEDLKNVLPAFCAMVEYLQLWNPGTTIINLVNPVIKSEIKNGMKEACAHYRIPNLELQNIDCQSGHPSIAGMASIANQVKSFLETI